MKRVKLIFYGLFNLLSIFNTVLFPWKTINILDAWSKSHFWGYQCFQQPDLSWETTCITKRLFMSPLGGPGLTAFDFFSVRSNFISLNEHQNQYFPEWHRHEWKYSKKYSSVFRGNRCPPPPKPVYGGSFSHEAVTLKIRSRSPKSNKLLILSDLYRPANLVTFHPMVHEMTCRQTPFGLILVD